MFGYVVGNLDAMTPAEKERYRAAYCGLCRCIGARSGQLARTTLTYDLVFLVLLLSSLYEPEETSGTARCVVHPAAPRPYTENRFTAYGADMNVILAYYKNLDDWSDERKGLRRALAGGLSKRCAAIEEAWPRQCERIRTELAALHAIEQDNVRQPDEAVNCFGALMGELFVYDEADHWADTLCAFGRGLGRFLYLMDAALDYERDKKDGAYNPLLKMGERPENARGALTLLIGEAADAFEKLPLEQDLTLLRGILYGGVWSKYDAKYPVDITKEEPASHDR